MRVRAGILAVVACAALALAGCDEQQGPTEATPAPQPSSGNHDMLMGGMLGYMLGSSLSSRPAPSAPVVVQQPATVVHKTVNVYKAPAPATSPKVVPAPAPTAAPKPSYSGPSGYTYRSTPSVTYRSTPSFSFRR